MFAIALTVLVLTIALPPTTHDDNLGHELGTLAPKYFAYALSFFTIGTLWLIHRLAFRRIARTDSNLAMWVLTFPLRIIVPRLFGGPRIEIDD